MGMFLKIHQQIPNWEYFFEEVTKEVLPICCAGDNWPKTVLTFDRYAVGTYEGITVQHVIEWLLQGEVGLTASVQ